MRVYVFGYVFLGGIAVVVSILFHLFPLFPFFPFIFFFLFIPFKMCLGYLLRPEKVCNR